MKVDLPPEVRLALLVVLAHVEPGWENCRTTVRRWLDEVDQPVEQPGVNA